MANAWYKKHKEQLLQGTASALLNGSGNTGVYACLINTDVSPYSANTVYFNDNAGAADVVDGANATPVEIGGSKTYTDGILNGDDVTFTAVAGTVTYEAIGIFVKTAGADTTWRMVAFLDTNVTGLPVTSNGGNITVTWSGSGIIGL